MYGEFSAQDQADWDHRMSVSSRAANAAGRASAAARTLAQAEETITRLNAEIEVLKFQLESTKAVNLAVVQRQQAEIDALATKEPK